MAKFRKRELVSYKGNFVIIEEVRVVDGFEYAIIYKIISSLFLEPIEVFEEELSVIQLSD